MLQDAACVLAARQELADLLQILVGDLLNEGAARRLRGWLDRTRPAAVAAQRRLAVGLRTSPDPCPNDGPGARDPVEVGSCRVGVPPVELLLKVPLTWADTFQQLPASTASAVVMCPMVPQGGPRGHEELSVPAVRRTRRADCVAPKAGCSR
jgi:hypothetical protein